MANKGNLSYLIQRKSNWVPPRTIFRTTINTGTAAIYRGLSLLLDKNPGSRSKPLDKPGPRNAHLPLSHKVNTLTVRNGNLNPPDVYPKDIWVPLQNQANRVGMVLTAESP
jgi:hypothetical protein